MTVVEANDICESRVAEAARDNGGLLLELSGVSKWFPGVVALDGVDFDLRRGEVHVLFGENGAGKSTLINIIAGTYPPDTGTFKYQGREVGYLTPQGARAIGISPVFQEFSLVPELTVKQNLFLGRELTAGGFLNHPAMSARAQAIIRELNFDLDPDRKVRQLSRAHQQMVEIAKAFLTEVSLLILDEPTASLTELGGDETLRSDRQAQSLWRGNNLRFASHAGDQTDRGPHHSFARRTQNRNGGGGRSLGKRAGRTDDRPQGRRAVP